MAPRVRGEVRRRSVESDGGGEASTSPGTAEAKSGRHGRICVTQMVSAGAVKAVSNLGNYLTFVSHGGPEFVGVP